MVIFQEEIMTINDPAISDVYFRLLEHLKKQRLTALIAGILVFGFLSFLSAGALIETHWFTFILFSIVSGYWFMFLGRLMLWFHFLRPHLKNRNRQKLHLKFPIVNALKKTKQTILAFCAITSCLAFSFFVFLIQQFHNNNSLNFFSWNNLIMLIPLSFFLGLAAFLVTSSSATFFLRITLYKNFSYHRPFDPQEDWAEYTMFQSSKIVEPEYNLPKEMREAWDHDPINPASAEYQSTYRRWNHDD
jgi:hypothetical protein